MAGIFTESLYRDLPSIADIKWYERLLLKFVWLQCSVDLETPGEIIFIYYKDLFNKRYILNIVRKAE